MSCIQEMFHVTQFHCENGCSYLIALRVIVMVKSLSFKHNVFQKFCNALRHSSCVFLQVQKPAQCSNLSFCVYDSGINITRRLATFTHLKYQKLELSTTQSSKSRTLRMRKVM